MSYTTGQLVTDIRNKLDDTAFSSTLIKDFINDTQRYIVNKHKFRFMEGTYTETLTIGDNSYALNSDVGMVEGLIITDPSGDEVDITSNFLTFAEFDKRYPDITEVDNGKPEFWTIRENSFYFGPAPDKAYVLTIRHQKTPTTLSADVDVPEVPEHYKELLILGSLVRAHKYNDNYDIAQVEQNSLDEQLLDMVTRTYTRQTGRPVVMRVNGRRA